MKVVDKGSTAPSCSRHIELAVWPDSSWGLEGEGREGGEIDDLSGVTVNAMKTSLNLFMTCHLLPHLSSTLQADVASTHCSLT